MTAPRTIPANFRLTGGAPAQIVAAAEGKKSPRFAMVLNSLQPFDGWSYNAILDAEGGELPGDGVMPMLRQHNGELIVGQSDKIDMSPAAGLCVDGDVYPETPAGAEVLALSAKGFRWQASFGIQPKFGEGCFEWVGPDETKTVNGHTFSNGLIIRKWRLKEGSFLPIGADSKTSAIAASAGDGPQIPLPQRSAKPMSDPTPAPAPKKSATKAELEAAFPGDENREFRLDQREAGSTVDEAKIAFSDVLKERLEAATKALDEAKKPAAPAKVARTPVAIAPAAPSAQAEESATSAWKAAVKTKIDAGTPKHLAAREVAVESPDLHKAYLSEANGREWAPLPVSSR